MKREITSHRPDGHDDGLTITVEDEAGPGGANHQYSIFYTDGAGTMCGDVIAFQKGPIPENGINGITNEVLLAIVIDRLEGFQSGEFACDHNHQALLYSRYALAALRNRTRDRLNRGVEGKLEA